MFVCNDDILKIIMPQKEPMLLCDGVFKEGFVNKEYKAQYTVGKRRNVAETAQGLPFIALMEVMAQAVAAVIGLRNIVKEGDDVMKMGLFLAMRNFKVLKRFDNGFIPKGTVIISKVYLQENMENIISINAESYVDDEIIASAKITVLNPSENDIKNVFAKNSEFILKVATPRLPSVKDLNL